LDVGAAAVDQGGDFSLIDFCQIVEERRKVAVDCGRSVMFAGENMQSMMAPGS